MSLHHAAALAFVDCLNGTVQKVWTLRECRQAPLDRRSFPISDEQDRRVSVRQMLQGAHASRRASLGVVSGISRPQL